MDTQVIVVGGGPAGSSTAWSLARQGVDVVLVDRARFPRDKVCAEYLSPQCSRIFATMGVLNSIESLGPAQLTGMKVRSPDGSVIHGEFAANHGFRGFRDSGLAVRRIALDEVLVRAAEAAGAKVIEGARVTDIVRESGRVTGIRFRGDGRDSIISAPVIVGADGLRSVVGRRLGLIHARRWPRRIALVAHYRGVRGVGPDGELHLDRSGYCGLADVGSGLTNFAVVVPVSRSREVSRDRNGFLESWIRSRPHLASRFQEAERIDQVKATGPFASFSRRSWAPGAALVGDAAEFFDPFTGEGVYSALRGGEILAPFIAEGLNGTTTLDLALAGYDNARRKEFSGKWTIEKMVSLAVATPWIANRMARALSRRREMADLMVGVAGDFVPPREVLRPSFILKLLLASATP